MSLCNSPYNKTRAVLSKSEADFSSELSSCNKNPEDYFGLPIIVFTPVFFYLRVVALMILSLNSKSSDSNVKPLFSLASSFVYKN